jgi:hypothetical protein
VRWIVRTALIVSFLSGAGCHTQRASAVPGCAPELPTAETSPWRSTDMAAAPRQQETHQLFNTGATGPGINFKDPQPLLNGALDPRTGWPAVFRDHFAPRPERLDRFWIVQTRDCPQVMGTDPWPCLKTLRFDVQGQLVERDPGELLAQVAGRPVLIQVQGHLTTADIAVGGLLWTHTWLDRHGALPADAVLIAFDWPGERQFRHQLRDVNDAAIRAFVAGFHLARFLEAFPDDVRVCLLGHSFGARAALGGLHLLGGGALASRRSEPPVRLQGVRPTFRLRAVLIAAAGDRHWLDPGHKLDGALVVCEGLLNLHNSKDRVLTLYPLLLEGDNRRSLGQVGFRPRDM